MINKRRLDKNLHWTKLFPVMATVLVLAVSGCAPQADVATEEVDVAAEEAAVKQMLADWVVATNQTGQAGADGYASFFTEDGVVLPPNAERQDGRDAVRASILGLTESEGFSMSWEANRVEVSAAADLAYAIGAWKTSLKDVEGNTVEYRGNFLDTFRKQADGSWKVSTVMFSSDLPVAAPMME